MPKKLPDRYIVFRSSGNIKRMKRKPWNVYEGDCLVCLKEMRVIEGFNKMAHAMGWRDYEVFDIDFIIRIISL